MSVFRRLYVILICIFLGLLLFFSSSVTNTVRETLSLCFSSVIPSLFPFLAVTKLFLGLRLADTLPPSLKKIMKPIFSVSENSFPALIFGLIGGYPVGATICASLYKDRLICRKEAERTLAFCNNAGPAFILSTVGIGMFSSLRIGTLLLLIHISSAVITGLLFKIFAPIDAHTTKLPQKNSPLSFSFAFTDSIYGAMVSSLTISAYIVFFSVVTGIITMSFPFFASSPTLRAFFCGVLEITSASYEIVQTTDIKTSFILISALLGWGGLCVHFQTLSFLSGTDIKISEYFTGKLSQSLISALLAFFISKLSFFEEVTVFADSKNYHHSSINILLITILLLIFYLFFKKGWKKTSA